MSLRENDMIILILDTLHHTDVLDGEAFDFVDGLYNRNFIIDNTTGFSYYVPVFGGSMSEIPAELFIELSLEGGDHTELDELTHQLRAEVEELNIDSVEEISAGPAPKGTKAADFSAIGQMAVTLAPTIVPPLFDLLKSWVERKPSTPVKVRVRVGRKTAQIEYDPTRTSAKDLEALIKVLNKSAKK